MILARYSELRRHFAATSTLADDGFPEWPGPTVGAGTGAIDNASSSSLLRVNGFSASLRATTAGGYTFPGTTIGPLVDASRIPSGDAFWPLVITCNGGASDATTGTHEYDWYLSQRRDEGRYPALGTTALTTWAGQLFDVTMPTAAKSGTIAIDIDTTAAGRLLPGLTGSALLTADAFVTLWRHCHLYVRRRSDGAYQWARLYLD